MEFSPSSDRRSAHPGPDATHDVADHLVELQKRQRVLMIAAASFIPAIAAVEREVSRIDEDIVRMKQTESDVGTLGAIEHVEQRHRSLHSAGIELRRAVQHVSAIAREAQEATTLWLGIAARRSTPAAETPPAAPIFPVAAVLYDKTADAATIARAFNMTEAELRQRIMGAAESPIPVAQ